MNLEPCPHCGGPAEHDSQAWNGRKVTDRENTGHAIYCASTECIGSPSFPTVFETFEEAAQTWNTRADRDQLRARVSEVEQFDQIHRAQIRSQQEQISLLFDERDAANEALRVAREAIEKAPHALDCRLGQPVSRFWISGRGDMPCTCWKAAALASLL